jgi:hypothetical protein
MKLFLKTNWRELDRSIISCYCPSDRDNLREMAGLQEEYQMLVRKHKRAIRKLYKTKKERV